uniref:Uncharacterized protein n=1 Tax=Arundo donax TaxID=35708 RepID=A0A0A8Z957_ARUDO
MNKIIPFKLGGWKNLKLLNLCGQ